MTRLHLFIVAAIAIAAAAGCSREEHSADAGHVSAAADDSREAGHEPGAIALTPQQIAAAGIEVAAAAPAQIREILPLYGVVTPNAVGVRQVSARYPGVVRTVTKSFGDPVRQGETLATVESNESLQTYTVPSPLTGVVTARDANPGEQTADRTLFTVADLSSVWVELALFPRDVGKVKVGQSVRIEGAAPDLRAEGEVIWVAPFGNSANQTVAARVLLDNSGRRWAPGLYVSAEILLGEAAVPVAVLNGALQTIDERSVVFVEGGPGFVARAVRVGRSDAEATEILSGLVVGERYVTKNSFILKADLGKGEAEHDD
jgi:cobalt-zinc-cadmium efflux system membrane fusion protein